MKTEPNHRRKINLDSKEEVMEASIELIKQSNIRLLFGDESDETWAITMGAMGLRKLAKTM